MMEGNFRKVILPDGRPAMERETLHHGGSETFASYEYYDPHTNRRISKDGFELDYWGAIEGTLEL